MKLLTKQKHAVYYLKDNETTELLYGGAAGGGKSAIGCLWLIEVCQKYPGSRWLMGRSKLKTLKDTTLKTFFELSSLLGISDQYFYNSQSGTIIWDNGSEIVLKDLFLYPSDPEYDSLGSLEITGAFIDECNQIVEKAKNVVKSRCRYKLNEFDLIPKLLMTCNPAKNWVYSQFYKPAKDNELKEGRQFIQALPSDNPHLPHSYLQSLLELDNASRQRLYYGNWEFDDDPAKLMEFDAITDIFTNKHVEEGRAYISADIARFGKDKTVIMVWNGLRVEKIVTLDNSSITETAEEINRLANKHKVPRSRTIVDEDGLGGGVKDILKCKGFVANSKAVKVKGQEENYSNLKSQCYYKLANRVNNAEIYICSEDVSKKDLIVEELEQVKRKNVDKDEKNAVIPKDKVKELIGRSPDYSDALMMRMWFDMVQVESWADKLHASKRK